MTGATLKVCFVTAISRGRFADEGGGPVGVSVDVAAESLVGCVHLTELRQNPKGAIVVIFADVSLADALGKSYRVSERLVRTETNHFHAQADTLAYTAAGVKEYEFMATLDSRTSEVCASLDGKVFKVKDAKPGTNYPPMHPNCRSTTVEYDPEDAADWAASGEPMPENMKYSEWKKLQDEEAELLRNNLPGGFKDTRHVGQPISATDLNEFITRAKSKGVQIGTVDNPTGGFETYCGSVKVLNEMVDEAGKQIDSPLFKSAKTDTIILSYDNVLGHNGDPSAIDVGAFASTKGRTITLNKFMFDDSDFLAAEYKEMAEKGYFVKGTDYRSIIAHEAGHIIRKKTRGLTDKIIGIFEKEATHAGVDLNQFIVSNVSGYAIHQNADFEYTELVSEVNSLLHFDRNGSIMKLLRKEGVL